MGRFDFHIYYSESLKLDVDSESDTTQLRLCHICLDECGLVSSCLYLVIFPRFFYLLLCTSFLHLCV